MAIEAATVEKKPNTTTIQNVKKSKDVKEKRDAAQTQKVPYSYETPQKTFQVPAQTQYQQKVAAIEYQQPRQEQHQQVQHIQHIQPQQYQKVQPEIQQQYQHVEESAPQQHTFSSYPSAGLESFFSQPMKSSGFGDFGYDFPGFENFEHVQGLNYNQNMQNINNAYVIGQYGVPSKSQIYSIKQQVEYPSFNYADLHSSGLAQTVPSYNFPMQSYAIPQQQLHEGIPSYFHSYAPKAQSYAPDAQSYAPQALHSYAPIELGYGFNEAALYTPQALAISASKPTKTPDYAHGVKGLGHFSTASALSAAAPTASYSKPSYQPQYQYIQQATEKPFRASAFLGSSPSHDSLTEQSIASLKPANDYLPPSKQYLPAKEQQLHQQQPQQTQQHYQQHNQQSQKHYQQPQQPQQHHQQPQQPQQQQTHHYIQHIPTSEHVQHVQYIQQQPSKTYIAPSHNSLSSKPFTQAPKNNYLPPQNNYLPPKSSYLPPKPSNSYIPANHQFTSSSNSNPAHHHHQQQQQQQYAQPQQYTQSHEDSYEIDYHSSPPAHQQQSAGHK